LPERSERRRLAATRPVSTANVWSSVRLRTDG
jgi:hypothetical protein